MMQIIPPYRGVDNHGSGAYLANRGSRIHQGVDIACYAGSKIMAVNGGKCTKIGFPYADQKKRVYRYVQITDIEGFDVRYFYVFPTVDVGDDVTRGQIIGETQGLLDMYPGITDHLHFEVKLNGAFTNPHEYIARWSRR